MTNEDTAKLAKTLEILDRLMDGKGKYHKPADKAYFAINQILHLEFENKSGYPSWHPDVLIPPFNKSPF